MMTSVIEGASRLPKIQELQVRDLRQQERQHEDELAPMTIDRMMRCTRQSQQHPPLRQHASNSRKGNEA